MVFLMQKNTMQKHFTPVGCFCRSVLSEEHFNKKHFTPVGCFCWPYFSSTKRLHTRGVFLSKCSSGKVRSTKRPQGCEVFFAHKKSTLFPREKCIWKSVLGRIHYTKRLHTPGVFLLTVLFLYKKTSHPWGLFVEVFFLKNTSTKRVHTRGVFLLTVLLIRTTLGFSLTKRPQTRKAWP